MCGEALDWIKSYLTQRQRRTEANGTQSGPRLVLCGVPQGSILGPLLFMAYINNVQDMIANVNGFMYAADLALVTSGKDTEHIQALL